jgi:hypothetical protein
MFLGRPVNLWVGLIGGGVSTAISIIGATQTPEIAQQWAIILGAVGGFLGVLVAFLAGQPPTLAPGDTFHISTPAGQPNTVGVVTPPEPVSVSSTIGETVEP